MATKQELSRWFDRGVEQGAKFMLVKYDWFDHSDYPVYVNTNPRDHEKGDRVMECYDLTMSKESQLGEFRAFHYGEEVST